MLASLVAWPNLQEGTDAKRILRFHFVPGKAERLVVADLVNMRAFAVSPSGAWCWAEEGEDPDTRALATCAKKSNQPCQLYSVDDYVVWPDKMVDAGSAALAGNGPGTGTGASPGASP